MENRFQSLPLKIQPAPLQYGADAKTETINIEVGLY
jgi:hypothetical protein